MLALPLVVNAQIKDWSSCVTREGIPTLKCLEIVVGNILFIASTLVVLVLFIMFVVGAFNYLTSFGNPDKVKRAQGTFKFAIIGFILFVSAFLILKTIDWAFLGNCGRIFRFEISTEATSCP